MTMNCTECRENLIARIEGLLNEDASERCRAHLETCADCQAEYKAIADLHQRLIARGHAAAGARIAEPVMRRICRENNKPERESIMNKLLKHRWGLGFGTAAAAAAIALAALLLSTSKAQAMAVEVISRASEAAAKLTSIHLRGQLRTPPADNFSVITPEHEFVTIELWKQFEPVGKWRVEKPGRVAVMDGQSAILFVKPDVASKVQSPASSAFDTQWLHEIANLSKTLNSELSAIRAHGWPVTVTQEQATDGKTKSIVTIEATSGLLTSDYLKNKFFDTADTRRVYVFNDQTNLLESAKIYIHSDSGEKLVFELDQIDYNPPISSEVFELQLPATVSWVGEMQMLPDNEKYAAMTSEEAARVMLEACGREDWTEAAKFFNPLTAGEKQHLGGLQVVGIREHFTAAVSLINGAQFVPYEIKLKNGEIRKHNLALKRDKSTRRWYVDGGI
jgi:Putative zinc-finger